LNMECTFKYFLEIIGVFWISMGASPHYELP
jgi:hypothetical protein